MHFFMKIPSLLLFYLSCTIPVSTAFAQINTYPYEQSFGNAFTTGENVEFISHWWGNEVSSGSSRIYQADVSEAYSGQAALGILPTAGFTAELQVYFDAGSLQAGEISFQARSGQNGSGSRAVLLSASFSVDGGETFSQEQEIGGAEGFPNANTDYRLYQLALPEEVAGKSDAVLRLRASRGSSGEGTVARLFIDDFRIGSQSAAFRLLAAEVLNATTLLLQFNREMDAMSAEEEGNYQISDGIEVTAAALDVADKRQLLLSLSSLQPGNTYTLRLGDVRDGEGNSAEGQEFPFTYTDSYELRLYDLLISEIHAAPNDHTLLPDVEWVELYNASGRTLELGGVTFGDESRSSTLPAHSLSAGGYVLLAPAAGAAELQAYGPVLGLSSWPSLNNDGDSLHLGSAAGKVLDRVAYRQGWYGSSDKAAGGWSLERIDLKAPCAGGANWTASMATAGGTPAKENSVATSHPDLRGPELLQAFATDSMHIQLLFNEALDTAGFFPAWFQLQPAVPVAGIKVLQADRLELQLAAPLSLSENYFLQLSNIRDCSGNLLQESERMEVAFPQPAVSGEVLVNEVMYDPSAGSEEWVELANASAKYINLQNWQLATYSNGIKATVVLSRNYLLLPPQGFLVFSPNTAAVQNAFPAAPEQGLVQLSGFPRLANTGDSLVLLNEKEEQVDLFGYSGELHSPFIQETKGVSLERISLSAPSNEAGNWTSAAATANYGTPGQANSQAFAGTPEEGGFQVEPEVILPGSSGRADFAAIRFAPKRQGLMARLAIYDEEGREIKVLIDGRLLGSKVFQTWDGTNKAGSRVGTGYYVVLLKVYNAGGYQRVYRKAVVVGNGFE